MKKQQKSSKKKLVLQKETVTYLEQVTGGSQYNDTVFRYYVTEYRCATDGCGYS
jgi:hypothetical protein